MRFTHYTALYPLAIVTSGQETLYQPSPICSHFHFGFVFFLQLYVLLSAHLLSLSISTPETHPPAFENTDTVYFPALLESRTKNPPSLFCEAQNVVHWMYKVHFWYKSAFENRLIISTFIIFGLFIC